MTKAKIEVRPNGPLKVTGEIEIYDSRGQLIQTNPKELIFLCRHGRSEKKPFCDGTHKLIKFDTETEAKETVLPLNN